MLNCYHFADIGNMMLHTHLKNLRIACLVVVGFHLLNGCQLIYSCLMACRNVKTLQGVHLQCREQLDGLVTVYHLFQSTKPEGCCFLTCRLGDSCRVHQSHTCRLIEPHQQSIQHKAIDG